MFRTTLLPLALLILAAAPLSSDSPGSLSSDSVSSMATEGPTPPADSLTLAEAQAEARRNSPLLRSLQAAADGAQWKLLEEASPYIPHLSVDGQQIFEQRYVYLGIDFSGEDITFPSAFPSSILNLNAEETLFDGFSAWQRFRGASHDSDAANLELNAASFRLNEDVALAFYRALASKLLVGVADQNIQTLQEHLTNVTNSAESGMATQFDVLRVQSKLVEANAEKLLEDDDVVIAHGKLLETMGMKGDDPRELQGELPEPDASVVSSIDLSPSARADLQAEATLVDSAKDRAGAAWSDWLPRVSIYGQESYYKINSFDPLIIPSDGYQNAYNVGLNMNWDIFDGGQTLAKAKEAGAKVDEAQSSYSNDLLKATQDIDDWKRRYLYNAALYTARQQSLQQNEEAVRLANLGLQAGTRSHSESLDAESDLFGARAGVVQAQIDALEAIINLELSLGHAISAQP